jgi:hypothetical protein
LPASTLQKKDFEDEFYREVEIITAGTICRLRGYLVEQDYRTLNASREWYPAMRPAMRNADRDRAQGAGSVGRRAHAVITW